MRKIAACLALAPLLALQSMSASAQAPADDATVVSDLQVAAPKAVPIPEVGIGAPLFSAETLQGFNCEARFARLQAAKAAGGQSSGPAGKASLDAFIREMAARRALSATREADRVRLEAGAGRRTQKEVEDAELARQQAVNAYQAEMRKTLRSVAYHPAFGVDWVALAAGDGVEPPAEAVSLDGAAGEAALPGLGTAPIEADLDSAIENVATRMIVERGKPVLLVTGTMRNIRDHRVLAQGLLITVFDRAGRILDMVVADSNGTRIRADRTIRFAYRLTSPPAYAHRVRVTFALPGVFTQRNYARWKCSDADDSAPIDTGRGQASSRPQLKPRIQAFK